MPKVTLFVLGTEGGKGAGAGWDGQRESGVGLAGLGGVEALRSGPWIESGGARSGSGVPLAGLWVGGRGWGGSGMGVKAEELIVLIIWSSISTLRLAARVSGKKNLPVNCHFTSTLDRLLDLLLEAKNSKAWGLGGEDGLTPLGCSHPCH